MLIPAKNYDIISFELISQMRRLESPLKEDLIKLLDSIREMLLSDHEIKPLLDDLLGQIFDLRLKAVKWIGQDKSFDLLEGLDVAFAHLERLKSNKKLTVLVENLLYALRWNRRVILALTENSPLRKLEFSKIEMPAMNYHQFIAAIAMSVPDEKVAQKIIDWTNSAMYIEFSALSISLISEERLNISGKVIDQITAITADAGQLYPALATEFGILGTRKVKSYVLPAFDEEYVNEQRLLVDQGLDDYAANLLNDET